VKLSRDVVVVGAGFAGVYLLQCAALARVQRPRSSKRAATSAEPGTGTVIPVCAAMWWYSYSFPTNCSSRSGSERAVRAAAGDPELHPAQAERFDLKRDIDFNTRVTTVRFDDSSDLTVETDKGDRGHRAFGAFMATGSLSASHPRYRRLVQLLRAPFTTRAAGRRKASISWRAGRDHRHSGSSAVQAIRRSPAQALRLLQRTPTFTVPASRPSRR